MSRKAAIILMVLACVGSTRAAAVEDTNLHDAYLVLSSTDHCELDVKEEAVRAYFATKLSMPAGRSAIDLLILSKAAYDMIDAEWSDVGRQKLMCADVVKRFGANGSVAPGLVAGSGVPILE